MANVADCGLGTAKYRSLTDKWPLLVPSLVEESYLVSAMDWHKSNSVRRVGGHVLGIICFDPGVVVMGDSKEG